MICYWFNRPELLQKAKDKYHHHEGKKAAKYYHEDKDITKEKANNKYKYLTKRAKRSKKRIWKK